MGGGTATALAEIALATAARVAVETGVRADESIGAGGLAGTTGDVARSLGGRGGKLDTAANARSKACSSSPPRPNTAAPEISGLKAIPVIKGFAWCAKRD